ncbi:MULTISPECIES: CaiB/BaiF CoA-transferase family protein [Oceanobacillus]|uniref:CoA transferase n=1 Tax=Oceanobacillus kimchii TaxID=746691 RepID=A0ABQ5TP11_9BACI|nr:MULTISPECIES: CaiB/BaiF CoA-transferase family protein [Oceanobacillus]MBT2600276.1 CoA transferase [Oceanobacillus sp. ISL-74]MBT2650434.1 CoA transferase [Oceanobacillus sp. ISL-73]GLO67324.1 CoA transferase [Oceanobacillus kimchii]
MPLSNIRVLDLTRLLPGPYCSMMLADFGAEVIKIEQPNGGDYLRNFDPKYGNEDSVLFQSINRNKKSVCLDLKDEEDKQSFLELLSSSDILIESFRPGVMKNLGLDYDTLKEYQPSLIYCSLTGYGQTGPYKDKAGHDINYLSTAGILQMMSDNSKKPVLPSVQIADIGMGAYPALIGILMAYIHRQNTGEGQYIDVSMLDGAVSWLHMLLPATFQGQSVDREKSLLYGGYACYQIYETKDRRYLSMGGLEDKFWSTFCRVIGKYEFISQLHASLEIQREMITSIQNIIKKKTLDEWMILFDGEEACVTALQTLDELVVDPHVSHREMIIDKGGMKQIGIPIKMSETPGEIRSKSPSLGEHNEELLNPARTIK